MRKKVCQCYALESPAVLPPNVSCQTGKGLECAKETPERNWSNSGLRLT